MHRSLLLLAGLALVACQNTTTSSTTAEELAVIDAVATTTSPDRPGFQWASDEDGRLWVWAADEPAVFSEKHITLIGAAPGGQTLKCLDRDTAMAFLATKAGFRAELHDGRVYVWPAGTEGEMPEKHVTFIAQGALGATVKATDREVGVAYLTQASGYRTEIHDGRIHVWAAGTEGEMPEKHVTRVGGGPLRMTVKATDTEVLEGYLAAL